MKSLKLQILNKDSFKPYGDIIDSKYRKPVLINQGKCLRFDNLANLSFENEKVGISLFNSDNIELPYKFNFMERHPKGSQAFIPVFGSRCIVIVANDEENQPGLPNAFITQPGQGFNIHRKIWHGTLAPLDKPGIFTVIDWVGSGKNLETHLYKDWYLINSS